MKGLDFNGVSGMPRKKMSDRDWLEKHLRSLMEMGTPIQEKDCSLPVEPPTYDKGYWTGLKLMLLKYYIPTYLNILAPRGRVAYCDPFAGPGLNIIGDRKIPVPGSPMVSVAHAGTKHRFNYYVFGDIRDDYTKALQHRVEGYEDENGIVVTGDNSYINTIEANKLAHLVPELFSEHNIDHCLFFIDPEGVEFRWESLEFLMSQCENSDLIILFPSAGLRRLVGRKDEAAWRTIRDFIGPGSEDLQQGSSEEETIELYRRNLSNLGKEISTEIQIKSSGPFHYHLIPAVGRTYRNSPWFRVFEEAKLRIERCKGDVLGIIAQQIDGELGTII